MATALPPRTPRRWRRVATWLATVAVAVWMYAWVVHTAGAPPQAGETHSALQAATSEHAGLNDAWATAHAADEAGAAAHAVPASEAYPRGLANLARTVAPQVLLVRARDARIETGRDCSIPTDGDDGEDSRRDPTDDQDGVAGASDPALDLRLSGVCDGVAASPCARNVRCPTSVARAPELRPPIKA